MTNISYVSLIILCAYIAAASVGWNSHLENPQGVLLYTPPANSTHPNYTPVFYVSFTITLTIIFMTSTAISLLTLASRFIFSSERIINLIKKLTLSTAIVAGATLLGVIACAMYL